jgi:hypothetical protein
VHEDKTLYDYEFDEPSNSSVNEVAVVQIDINRHQKSRTFFYIVLS